MLVEVKLERSEIEKYIWYYEMDDNNWEEYLK